MHPARFAEVYEKGRPRTVRFLLTMGFSEDGALELAQCAWTRAWERIHQLRAEDRLLSWVNAIALNEGRREIRRVKLHVELSVSCEPATTLSFAAIDVATILKRCHPADRALLQAQLEGVQTEELAGRSGVSSVALRLRHFRARRAARQQCQPSRKLAA